MPECPTPAAYGLRGLLSPAVAHLPACGWREPVGRCAAQKTLGRGALLQRWGPSGVGRHSVWCLSDDGSCLAGEVVGLRIAVLKAIADEVGNVLSGRFLAISRFGRSGRLISLYHSALSVAWPCADAKPPGREPSKWGPQADRRP